jgi:hypothetical protein
MKFRLTMLASLLMLLVAPFASAQTFCNNTIIDQAKVIRNPQVVANAARTLINQGADVHVVTVNSASFSKYGQLAGVESFLESQCPGWTTNGVRKANLYVVMVAPNERAKNMFLGSYYAGAFDIPSTYSQLSNASFKAGDFGSGLAAALQGTTTQALNFHQRQFTAQQQQRQVVPQQRTYTPTPSYQTTAPVQTADSGISGFAIFMTVMFVLVVLAIILYFVFRESNTTSSTTTTYVEPSYDSTSYGRRSYGAAAPGHTTIINNTTPQYDSSGNLITGVLIGEALSRNNQPNYYPPSTPVYVEPTPSYVPETPAAPVQDAPDSSWEQQAAPSYEAPAQETTSFEPDSTPSYEAPSVPDTDFGSSNNDTGF